MAKTNPPRSLQSAPRHHGRANRGSTAADSPSPGGEGRGEGEETLRTPARLRIADAVGYSERRKTKLHARQSDESLAVASRLLPHPSPLPQGENSPKTIFAPGSPEPRSRRSNEAERVVAQGNPPRYLGGYEPEVHGQGTAHPALRRVEALWTGESVACGSPSPRGGGTGILRLLKSGVVLTGTVRSAIQRRDASTTQRVRFATQRRAILPLPMGGPG